MQPLHDKVAIVTGGSRGIGAATAIMLAKAGADVVINYFSSEKDAQHVLAEVQSIGRKGKIVQADVRNPEDVQRLVEQTVSEFGKVDILINNANIEFAYKPFTEMKWDEFSYKLSNEMGSAFHVCQAVVPHMIQQGGGKIVLISSSLSRTPSHGFIAHGTAKAAVVAFAKYLAQELGPHNITTNVIAPGLVLTDATKDQPAQVHETLRGLTPLQRLAQPDDIAGAVLSLVADWNTYVTGAYIPVNGGIDMS
ncbi:SDR family NAD(P)-dependent oxidoreductase [Paenibacillus xerothermodurans]|uniref:SDR family NAD(P)-dependent oxidoreductase n=1 Tax=Paenibacillus xerothermodurans TaxID=1977292 RepID=A0A2W1NAH0_PAEXE|nr:glucose 1-dehydrogenase [Paenibacillus xerothermodurans]PZE20934.1 SDR family NAD(P)-dependent oxidoreductase [Paenibacillus xerothermodurans]